MIFHYLFGFYLSLHDINRSTEITHESEGFYRTKYARHTGKRSVCLALLVDPAKANPIFNSGSWRKYSIPFQTHRPHLGTQVRPEKYEEVIGKGEKIDAEEAEKLWNYHQDFSTRHCSHMFWSGRCPNSIVGVDCDVSLNCLSLFLICSVWFYFS